MKLVIGMLVIALALGFFIFATFVDQKSNAILYYYTVAEALANPAQIGDSVEHGAVQIRDPARQFNAFLGTKRHPVGPSPCAWEAAW